MPLKPEPKTPTPRSQSVKKSKSGRKQAAVRIVEVTRWIPATPSTDFKAPNGSEFFLTNGVVGVEMLDDEVLFDTNVSDVGIREEIEINVRGKKEMVMHSLYFFQFIIGRIMPQGDQVSANPRHTFRPQRPSGLVTPNGSGQMPGLPGGPPLG